MKTLVKFIQHPSLNFDGRIKRLNKRNIVLTFFMLASLGFNQVFAAANKPSSITFGIQGSAVTYGTVTNSVYSLTIGTSGNGSSTSASYVISVTNLPTGATYSFSNGSFGIINASGVYSVTVGAGGVSGTINMTITNSSSTPAGSFTTPTVSITVSPSVSNTFTYLVGQKALTITGLSGVNKVYDGLTTATATGTASLNGVISGDVVTLGGTPSYAFASSAVNNAISITTTGYSISGAQSANYSLAQPTLSANITPKALTVTGAAVTSKLYDGNTSAIITGTLTGIVSPDVVTLTGTGTYTSSAVGNAIGVTSAVTLSGAAAGNYTITTQPTGLTGNIYGIYYYNGRPDDARSTSNVSLIQTGQISPAIPNSASYYTSGGAKKIEILLENNNFSIVSIVAEKNTDGINNPRPGNPNADFALVSGTDYTWSQLVANTITSITINASALQITSTTFYNFWVRFTDAAGTTTFEKLLQVNAAALPVTLSNFSAKAGLNNTVNLAWSTSSEIVNKGFRIERQSAIGNGKFDDIGFVPSKASEGGSSSSALFYNFVDVAPASNATNYYRLAQVDLDGKTTYSDIRLVRNGSESVTMVYPNPSNGSLNISRSSNAAKMNIQVMDMSGKVIQQYSNVSDANFKMNINKAGIYNIKMMYPGTGEQSIQRIVVQK